MTRIKPLFITTLLTFGVAACTSPTVNPPPVSTPSTATEKSAHAVLSSYDARLGDIGAYLEVASHEITDKPTVAVLTPARVLAGPPNESTVKAANTILASAKEGDLGPSRAAVIAAQGRVHDAASLRSDLNHALEADRAALKSWLDEHNAAAEAEMKKDRARLWHLLSGLMIAAGALVTTLGIFVRLLAVQVPVFGPKAAGAIMGAGGSLAAGGVCLYAIGPHLSILAAALGIAALLALIAGVLIYANKAHEGT